MALYFGVILKFCILYDYLKTEQDTCIFTQ
jgi:hypothetical protein